MAHTSKFIDYTINCFITKNNKVLLIYNNQYNLWLAPGGHIDRDENIEDSLYREIEEETGISKSKLKLIDPRGSIPIKDIFSDLEGHNIVTPTFTDIHKAGKSHYHIGFRYFFKTKADIKTSKDVHVVKHKWFTEKELSSPEFHLLDHVRYYAKYALSLK